MKLIDYIASNGYSEILTEKGYEYYEEINFSCEVHGDELLIVDGFSAKNMDISYAYTSDFIDLNPHFVWLGKTLEPWGIIDWEPTKVIYCESCEKNKKNFNPQSPNTPPLPPRRVKGQRSKKYKQEK